jgi:uncharacterized protein involved in exopolysaccharide biosynthesis
MDPLVSFCVVAGVISVPWAIAVYFLFQLLDSRVALKERRIAELEREVEVLEDQGDDAADAAADAIELDRRLAAAQRVRDRAARRAELLHARHGGGGAAPAPAGGRADGPDGGDRAPAGRVA